MRLQFLSLVSVLLFFFFQAEDGIRDLTVTGVQTCALPILRLRNGGEFPPVTHDVNSLTAPAHVRLNDERSLLDDRVQQLQVRRDPAAGRWNPGGAEKFGSKNLISRSQAPRIGIEQPRALGVQHAREAER